MKNLTNLPKSRQSLNAADFDTSERHGGTSIYFKAEPEVIASSGDFTVTSRSGNVTVGNASGYNCSVGSRFLTRVSANEIVDWVREAHLTGRAGNWGRGKEEGFNVAWVSDGMIGKPFQLTAEAVFVEFDDPEIRQIDPSTTLTVGGITVVSVSLTVLDQQ